MHLTLLSLASKTYRTNGGVGFALNNPFMKITVTVGRGVTILDRRSEGLRVDEIAQLTNWILSICQQEGIDSGFKIEIVGDDFCAHKGLGSGTSTRLAIAEAILTLAGRKFDRRHLVSISGRGGTSGVGINTYFDGGYVFDLGRAQDSAVFKSSDEMPIIKSLPLVMNQGAMPGWDIGICLPNLPGPSMEKERALFDEVCPLAIELCAEATFHALFGVHAAILEHDYTRFCLGINAIQNTAWKRSEWSIHGSDIFEIRDALLQSGADCVGLSSLGPTMFFMAKDMSKTIMLVQGVIKGKASLFATSARNTGRSIAYA